MKIASVTVSNFKSLASVGLDLSEYTVITGPNNAGKSNLVDAINFIGEVYAFGLEQAIVKNGGLANLVRVQPDSAATLDFAVRANLGREDVQAFEHLAEHGPWASDQVESFGMFFDHAFSLRVGSGSLTDDFQVVSDQITFRNLDGNILVQFGYDSLAPHDDPVKFTVFEPRLTGARMLRDILGPLARKDYGKYAPERANLRTSTIIEWLNVGKAIPYLKQGIGGIRLFQLSPYQCRQSSVSTPNAMLDRYGGNLPAASLHLSRSDAEAWGLVLSGMESIFPELEEVTFASTQDRRLALEFKEHQIPRAWSVNEVSDGTIQAFALLVALYDSRSPVLMVEEPENSVHPWILRQFIDLTREVHGKQIVLTTHSPVVLNYVPPSAVHLMTASTGESRISRLVDGASEVRTLIDDGELGVFELYDSGLIDSSVPGGLAKDGKRP